MHPVVYNVTIKIEKAIAEEWLQWLIKEHAPQVIATGCFTNFTVLKILEHDDEEGPTYAIQYFSENMERYHHYINKFANQFRKEFMDKWGNKFVAFRTVMQVVN